MRQWTRTRLQHLFERPMAGAWGDEPLNGEGTWCVRVADFNRERGLVSDENQTFRSIPPDDVRRLRLRRGDLLLEKSGGGPRQPVGTAVLFEFDDTAVSSNFVVRLRPVGGHSSRFMNYLLRAMYATGITASHARQTTGIQNLDVGGFLSTAAATPSPREQRRIADFLDAETASIDALIAKKRRMIELARERRSAAVDHFILHASGPYRPIAALGTYINGWPFKPADFTTDGLPVIRIRQLVDPSAPPDLYDSTLPDRVLLRDGDIVFSWSGSLEVRAWNRGPAWLNQHLFRVLPSRGVNRHWLLFALDCASRLFEPFMHGSAMTHITQPMMKAVRVPLPSVSVQEALARRLTNETGHSRMLTQKLDRQIELLQERRQALITAAVTGQIPVPV